MPQAEVRPASRGLIRALGLSLAAAAIPVAGVFLFPDDLRDYEALTWLLLLVPAFLWAYERGWRGVATALAAGMATVSTTYVMAEVSGRDVPDLLLPVIVIYVFVSLGIGLFGQHASRSRFDAATHSLALQDPLTALPNREQAELHTGMQFTAARHGTPVAVIAFEIDGFPAYVTQHGPTAGDNLLRALASLLRRQTRRLDLAARWGAHDFMSVISGCSEQGAVVFASRMQDLVRTTHDGSISISAGVACYRPEMQGAAELLDAAGAALAHARQDGGDRIRVHGRSRSEARRSTVQAPTGEAADATISAIAPDTPLQDASPRTSPEGPVGVGRSVFLLTADERIRAELSAFLKATGFAVTEGASLVDMMAPLQREFDLVLTDVGAPGTSAADMIRQLRERSPATRVMGIPRRDGDALHADTLLVRVDAYYQGLGNRSHVEAQVRELLAEGDALREAQVRQRMLSDEIRAMHRESRLALEASEHKYRQVVESVHEVIFRTDAEGRWTFLNPAWTAITGFTAEESVGQPLFRFITPEDEPAVRTRFLEALDGGSRGFRHECRWRTRHGPDRWIELRLQLDLSPSGTVTGSSGVLADTTDRRRAEAALRRNEEYFRSLIENSGDLIAVLNADATFRYASPAIERVFGYPVEELLGADPMRLVHPADEARTREGLALVLDDPGVTRTAELRVRNRSGDWRHVELTCRNLLLTPGVEGIVINARDVTERIVTEAALRESEQLMLRAQKMEAIGRLAGGVAHDFNNLLTTIHGHVDLLMADVEEGSPVHRDLREVGEAAERATLLTRQLLAFSRRQVMQPRVVGINTVIRDLERTIASVAGPDAVLSMQLEEDAGHVRVDPSQIEQVLLNLVVNARDAMPGGGTIEVATSRRTFEGDEATADVAGTVVEGVPRGTCVVLRVTDSGTGMEPAVAAQAFEPFFTTKGPGGGTGLGLSTVYGIVKQSGGHVWLNSRPGAGTEAVVALPAAIDSEPADDAATVRHAVPTTTAQPTAPEDASRTVLVVEDEKAVRDLTERILVRYGYRVLSAAGGREALEVLGTTGNEVDLLLSDVVMPDIGGLELAATVRRRMPQLPVLFMSGYNEEAILHDGVLVEGAHFLEKPFTPAALVGRVSRILETAVEGGVPPH
ncbi:MAG TPA: PAS domain S-box protein [Longimicrobiales bacterium]|nr:PAS domain S-box protein [Longimicrobiales bacterium]